VGVLQPGREPDLPLEALGAQRGGKLGLQQLQGDGAVVPQIMREEHRGDAAVAQLALEHVAVADGFGEAGRNRRTGFLIHASISWRQMVL
jgi:hypothetical protein